MLLVKTEKTSQTQYGVCVSACVYVCVWKAKPIECADELGMSDDFLKMEK